MFAATSNHPDFYDYQIEAYAEVLHPLFNAGAQTSAEAETAVEEQAALVELPAGDMSGMMGGMLPELPEGGMQGTPANPPQRFVPTAAAA